jgi:hypothetical protein
MRPLLAFAATVLCASTAAGQAAPTIPDPLQPREGRVPVEIVSSRGGPFLVGLAPAPPSPVEQGTRFSRDEHVRLCRTPCTLHLPPGAHRLFGDAGSDHAWRADVIVAPGAGQTLRFRGHLPGLSAAGGALFIVGLAGALGGPAVIIANIAVGETEELPTAVAGGLIAAAAGALALWGGLRLLDYAGPRLEGGGPVRLTLAPAPLREGAALVGLLEF